MAASNDWSSPSAILGVRGVSMLTKRFFEFGGDARRKEAAIENIRKLL